MLTYGVDNRFLESTSPHSIGLQNNLTVPNPGWDTNPLLINTKRWIGSGNSSDGFRGMGCCGKGLMGLTFDGTGLFGTGLFSGDITTWGISEAFAGILGVYAIYAMFHQAKQTKYRAEGAARRRRVKRAASLRAKAKRLEEKTEGIF